MKAFEKSYISINHTSTNASPALPLVSLYSLFAFEYDMIELSSSIISELILGILDNNLMHLHEGRKNYVIIRPSLQDG